MPYRDPKCIYVADSFAMAGLVQSWLASHDILVQIMDEATLGGLQGLTWMAPGVSIRGLEVWAVDPAQAEPARVLLAEKEAEIKALRAERTTRTGIIEATCPECGKTCIFPASQAGRTEHCTHCRAYLDVPDPDADPEGIDWQAECEPET